MRRWNVAIVGMGFIGKLHYDALRRLPNVHIRTIVVHKAEDIPRIKAAYEADIVTDCWQEAVADGQIDVIHNCTPNALHDQVNAAAISAGKQYLPVTIVEDTYLSKENLRRAGKDETWLKKVLAEHNTDVMSTYLLTVDASDQVLWLGKEKA